MTNEEIEVLQTIYTHDFTISNTNPRWYGVMVATGDSYQHENSESIEQQYVHVLFHEPPGYPSVPVEVRIATPVLITNSKASNYLNVNDGNVKEELEIILNLKAQEMANNEEFAMYEIAELARNWLWDNQQLSNTFNVSHDWWVGELPDRIFNWQTNSYSPSKITELQFRVELQVIENCNIKVDVAKVRSFLMMNLWNVEKTIEAITKNINENNHDANISITHVATDDVDEKIETSFEVFDINDMQFLPGTLQRKFKQDVIIHSQTIRKEQADLDILIKQYKNGLNTKNNRKLRIHITKLLIQIHYVIKFASVGLFCKSDKDKNEVKKGMEILRRLEFGLRSLENVREQIIEIERDNFGKEKRFKQLECEIEQCKERLENNIKNLVKLLNYLV
ncbi:14590_t:CDS:2 [Racocetra fulgida]|uniref:14590_t:CDS:1 n=1 Tax=Racocetra fulgida TaxID=60492 RepID=A0A9N9C253_9GLOM|nr:14590_t:CDS:2 [Racocetra fulgida]